jgi:hypothetical protein
MITLPIYINLMINLYCHLKMLLFLLVAFKYGDFYRMNNLYCLLKMLLFLLVAFKYGDFYRMPLIIVIV